VTTLALSLDELLAYTDEERGKWRAWLEANPAAMHLRMQPDGRFSTVGALIDHIFLVEARYVARFRAAAVPNASGVSAGDLAALFAYGARIRDDLRAIAVRMDDGDASTPREMTVQSGTFRITPRKVLLHICIHEIRHWAQIALAVRQAGSAPPGDHDLFFSRALD
jgi:uncharacterized damage-inducible protein DinB